MSSADLYEDGFPHGTVDGYNAGCRGSACPGQLEHGISCRRAQQLSHGDYRYKRLAAAGHTPAQIAAELDGTNPHHPATPTTPPPAPKATHPKESPMPKPTPADIPRKNPTTTPPAPTSTGPEQLTTAKWTEGLNPRAKTAKLREIREWARANGHPDVPTHGKIPHDALAAYDAATSGISIELIAEHATPLDAIPTDLEPNDTADAELEQPEPEPADEQADIAHRSDLLDETRTRIAAGGFTPAEPHKEIVGGTDRERVVPIGGRLCKQCAQQNHPGCTGRIYHGEKSPRCACTCPAARFLNANHWHRIPTHAPTPTQTTPTDTGRPQWADVTIPEDIERARRIAVQLEQELAHTTEQLTTAHNALNLALQRWAAEKNRADHLQTDLTVALGATRLYAALLEQDDLLLTEQRRTGQEQLDRITQLTHRITTLTDRLHTSRPRWWNR